MGFYFHPWQTVRYDKYPSIGRFEAGYFDPLEWRPSVPTAALRHARATIRSGRRGASWRSPTS